MSHGLAAPTGRPPDVLLRIAERRREDLAGERASRPVPPPVEPPLRTVEDNAFLAALRRSSGGGSSIIAEVKLGSPRLGSLVGRVDPPRQARLYREHGAAALSVVVEPHFFHGSYEALTEAVAASGLPAIAKDFVVDPLQIAWAREAGASAVLLVAALLSSEELRDHARLARSLDLVPLVETHSSEDRAKLGGAAWELVGVNNRDLRTFEVDLAHSIRSLPELPPDALRIAESGIRSRGDVERLERAGFDAFLIGEILLTAADPGAVLDELRGANARG